MKHSALSQQMTEVQEQFLSGLFDEITYADRIRSINASAKPAAWQVYQEALAYTEDMRARGFYTIEKAYQFARLTAWQRYLDAPLEQAA